MTRTDIFNESRRLVKWGSSNTLIVSLPRKWVKSHNLSDQDDVFITEATSGSLIISSQRKNTEEEIEIALDASKFKSPLAINLVLLTKYLDGYNTINIVNHRRFSPGEIANISEIAENLLGFEITKKTPTEISLKDIMSIRETNILLLIKILTRQTNELYTTLLSIITGGKQELGQAGTILQSQKTIEKYFYRINRQLRKALAQPSLMVETEMSNQDILDYTFYITYLHEASLSLAGCARTMIKQGYYQPPPEVIEFLTDCKEQFIEATRGFLFQQAESAFELIEKTEALVRRKRKTETNIDKTADSEMCLSLQVILDNIERVIYASNNIALTTIRSSL